MLEQRHSQRGRLMIAGCIILILLIVCVLFSGRIINRMATRMNDRIITQIGEYHLRILKVEIGSSEKALQIAASYFATHTQTDEDAYSTMTTTLMQSDPKIGRIWMTDETGSRHYGSSLLPEHPHELFARFRNNAIIGTVTVDTAPCWHMIRSFTDINGHRCLCGIELPLARIFSYMAESTPASRSYAILYNPDGIIVYHPDSLMLGRKAVDAIGSRILKRVLVTGRQEVLHTESGYLHIDEERIYYPLEIGQERWVAGIGIPKLELKQEIGDLHFYTVLTALVTLLLFATLLFLAQQRWRREYRLRLASERESEQLHLQQVLEQIDPHFLFNSLNSLYALIRSNPEEARDFTLTLARVYRHVLERRHEILASVNDEIDFTWQYYSLQKIRLGDCIKLTTAIDPSLRNRRIPTLSLQTLVENAIKHNRITAQNPLHIRISTMGDELLIENNYTPRTDDNAESLGVGLERIRSVYRFYTQANLTISIGEGNFSCRLPLLDEEK